MPYIIPGEVGHTIDYLQGKFPRGRKSCHRLYLGEVSHAIDYHQGEVSHAIDYP